MKRTLTIAAALLALIAGVGCQKTEPTTPVDPTPTDRYADAVETTLAKIDALKEGTQVCVKNVNVIAATTSFKIIHDGTDIGATTADLQIGKKATIKGVRSGFSQYIDYVAITDCDVYDVTESDYKAPEAVDITEGIDTYTNEAPTLVTVSGNVTAVEKDGDKIITLAVSEDRSVRFIHPLESLGFASLKGHDVTVTAYVYDGRDKIGLIGVATKVEDEGLPPVTERLAEWVFSADKLDEYNETFAETAANLKEGDGGKYVAASTGNARITYVNVDKTNIAISKGSGAQRRLTANGQPNTIGGWKGDYWLFNVTLDKSYPAGSKIEFKATTHSSGGGMKYWILEIYDGGEWVPMSSTKTETITDKDGANPEEVTYNFAQSNDKADAIEATYSLVSAVSGSLQIRYRSTSNHKANITYQTGLGTGWQRLDVGPTIDITYEQK